MQTDPQTGASLAPDADNDDAPVGRLWSRREMLAWFGAAGGGLLLAACVPALPPTASPAEPVGVTAEPAPTLSPTSAPATAGATEVASLPSCIVTPEMTEGPFFVDEQLNRSDIRADPATGVVKEGALLTLTLFVTRVAADACAPLPGALVDIWHCDADGLYSGVQDARNSTVGQSFLRGQQVTDSDGRAEFVTIYPGWYPGRTVHIHFKVRGQADGGGTFDATSQLFFDDAFTDVVFERAPYAARGERTTRNDNDGIFRAGGDQLIVAIAPDGEEYRGRFDIGLAL